jgi:hypothetical protein
MDFMLEGQSLVNFSTIIFLFEQSFKKNVNFCTNRNLFGFCSKSAEALEPFRRPLTNSRAYLPTDEKYPIKSTRKRVSFRQEKKKSFHISEKRPVKWKAKAGFIPHLREKAGEVESKGRFHSTSPWKSRGSGEQRHESFHISAKKPEKWKAK